MTAEKPEAKPSTTMSEREFQDAVLHLLHVQLVSAKESAAYHFGRSSSAFLRLSALAQLCLSLNLDDANMTKQSINTLLKKG